MVHFRTYLYVLLFLAEELVRFPFLINNHCCNIWDCFSTSSLARVIKSISFLRKYVNFNRFLSWWIGFYFLLSSGHVCEVTSKEEKTEHGWRKKQGCSFNPYLLYPGVASCSGWNGACFSHLFSSCLEIWYQIISLLSFVTHGCKLIVVTLPQIAELLLLVFYCNSRPSPWKPSRAHQTPHRLD